MCHFKSDFLEVLMLIIVFFSFTNGDPNTALKICEKGMSIYFGLDTPLLSCVKESLGRYRYWILHYINQNNPLPYTQDVNEYYWSMYKLVSAENIITRFDFCKNLGGDEIKEALHAVDNPNFNDCKVCLESFEVLMPEPLFNVEKPIGNQQSTLYALFHRKIPKKYELKEKILFNALYYQGINSLEGLPDCHSIGTYGAAYLKDIGNRVELINDLNYTPREFCNEKHKPKENDAGTSTSS